MQFDSRGHRVRRQSGIPTSTSRDSSPNRLNSGLSSMERRLSASGRNRHYVATNERQTPLMAEQILQQSQEAEAALEDALITGTESHVMSPRKKYNNLYDDHSDESETSRYDSFKILMHSIKCLIFQIFPKQLETHFCRILLKGIHFLEIFKQ